MGAIEFSFKVLLLHIITAALVTPARCDDATAPIATTRNGSYYGVHQSTYNQDFFLGVPFAQPPLGDFRFANPVSLNGTWSEALPATDYSAACIGYLNALQGFKWAQSEDCLYLNIVRPSGYENISLPVAIWIHGGGFAFDSCVSERYNLTFIVQNSVKIGKPIIGISIAFRLGAFGFLNGDEIAQNGLQNLGLKDQRMAMQWVQENIEGFGGDPEKVTLWGESAGAHAVGLQILAFNGRDDKLFRAGIMESGNPIFWQALNTSLDYQPAYEDLVNATGCLNSTDSLDCLRKLPLSELNDYLNATSFTAWWLPVIDGDFIPRFGSEQLADGSFVHVPLISGANSDEGEAFSPKGIDNTSDFIDAIQNAISSQTGKPLPQSIIDELLQAYPDDPSFGIPSSETLGGNVSLGEPYGAQFRRSSAYFGDEIYIAGRRHTCQTWASANVSAYCYRFNAIPHGNKWPIAVDHFQEVALVFNNVLGLGYDVNPFTDNVPGYEPLSELMSKSWASFIYDLDPNSWSGRDEKVESWPIYGVGGMRDFVFDANVTSFSEEDTWRDAGIKIINANWDLYMR